MEHVRVFARASPSHKEAVLLDLKARGHFTLMCGDGTNDVGALKASHVGVALLSSSSSSSTEEREWRDRDSKSSVGGASAAAARGSGGSGGGSGGGSHSGVSSRSAHRQPTLRELKTRLEAQMAEEEYCLVRLGDASIAAPFTCRQSSIYPTTRIIQQGRCTLVTSMRIYITTKVYNNESMA
jgi:cation-transporting ATPase 13A1